MALDALQRLRGRDEFRRFWDSVDLGFAHYLDGELVGHTSFLNDRPEDRVVEIGNTWLNPAAWGTGANTEAKYLLMRHAFEDEGYLRVEFKTDAANERSRPALEKVGATFEGVAPQAPARARRRAARLGVVRGDRRRLARGEGEPRAAAGLDLGAAHDLGAAGARDELAVLEQLGGAEDDAAVPLHDVALRAQRARAGPSGGTRCGGRR